MSQPRPPTRWFAWLLLAAWSSGFAEQTDPGDLVSRDLISQLGLPAGTYWIAQGGAPVPLDDAAAVSGSVLVLRQVSPGDQGLVPVGWYDLEGDEPATVAGRPSMIVDRQGPAAQLRLADTPSTGGLELRAAPDTRLTLELDDPSGVASWRLRDTHPVSTREGRWVEGAHELTVFATDPLGNETRSPPFRFVVDGTGPAIDWEISAEPLAGTGGAPVYAPPVPLTVQAADPSGVASIEFDAGDGWRDASSALTIDATEVALRATDELGNVSVTQASWRFDQAPPQIRVVPEGEGRVFDAEIVLPVGEAVRFEITDDGVGVAKASYRYNRNPPRPIPTRLRFRDRGWYQLEVRASDHLGNEAVRYFDVRTSPRRYRPDRAQRNLEREP